MAFILLHDSGQCSNTHKAKSRAFEAQHLVSNRQ